MDFQKVAACCADMAVFVRARVYEQLCISLFLHLLWRATVLLPK